MNLISAAAARELANGPEPTFDELLLACVCSIRTSAIAGSTSIAQEFDNAYHDKEVAQQRIRAVARQLTKLGFKVTTGAGVFIDIDWS